MCSGVVHNTETMIANKFVQLFSSSSKSKKHLAALFSILSFLTSVSWAENLIMYPCVDLEAIRWVRDSTFCDQYYICHFGQPLAMPSCPSGQVWSNEALNCVPRYSRWDDCSVTIDSVNTDTTVTTEYSHTTTQQSPNSLKVSEVPQTENDLIISIKQLPVDLKPTVLSEDDTNIARVEDRISLDNLAHNKEGPKYWYDNNRSGKGLGKDDVLLETTASTTIAKETKVQTSIPWLRQEDRRLSKVLHENPQIRFLQRRVNSTSQLLNVDTDHQCIRQPGTLLPHPENCHWYFNCSLANLDDPGNHTGQGEAGDEVSSNNNEAFIITQPYQVRQGDVFVWECRYPQLFDEVSGRCREFMNVDCKSRFEPVDQCEYSARQCKSGRCVPCDRQFGRCRGRQNGVYPLHPTRWTPVFVTCYQERNIAQDECTPPTPIFSPEQLDCVSLFDVPKQHGGFLPDCSTRPDGYYPDEQGRCAIFFRCALGQFRGYDECPPGSTFDPAIPACRPYSYASKPCGEGQAPLCGGKLDGLYADPYGRCTHYFQCQQGIFQQYFTCDLGIFDPLTQRCVISAELTVRPCGLQPSPCEALPTGVYPDQATGCSNFIECHHGNMITNGTCERGTMFSAITGRCDLPEYTPPPCGVSTVCSDRPDGRYPAMERGCSFFYECYHGEFVSLRRCTEADGGIFFNPETGTCDYPQNICPPCGYRWWGCPRTYQV